MTSLNYSQVHAEFQREHVTRVTGSSEGDFPAGASSNSHGNNVHETQKTQKELRREMLIKKQKQLQVQEAKPDMQSHGRDTIEHQHKY